VKENRTAPTGFNFDNSYADQLEGFYVPWKGEEVPAAKLIKFNVALSEELGLNLSTLHESELAEIFAGSVAPEGASPLAQAYAGHQFGGFSPQLGDGRALLLGEILDKDNNRWDIQLKGSGRTPFSRSGDGKAAVGPVLREYIISEAMHALNIPTTRALGAVTTGEEVQRETPLPGAVLARVAASHIRVGTFQFFSARDEIDKVKQLADYAIARHYPELVGPDEPYLGLLQAVRDRQAATLAKWMLVGFVHGVMNTDNSTISGETIDFGPCAFLDTYESNALFSSIDAQGRYAYGNQPIAARWNLARLAETLLPLLHSDHDSAVEIATKEVNVFGDHYLAAWTEGMREKLGLFSQEDGDIDLINTLYSAMDGQAVDFTQFFRGLSQAALGEVEPCRALFNDPGAFDEWHTSWRARIDREAIPGDVRAKAMNRVNPIYIPRNHKVEEALRAATEGADYSKFEKLIAVIAHPFEERDGLEDYAKPAPANFGPYTTYCGT
jgi:uncharacterized protein YdiU (UPF0061 family)